MRRCGCSWNKTDQELIVVDTGGEYIGIHYIILSICLKSLKSLRKIRAHRGQMVRRQTEQQRPDNEVA